MLFIKSPRSKICALYLTVQKIRIICRPLSIPAFQCYQGIYYSAVVIKGIPFITTAETLNEVCPNHRDADLTGFLFPGSLYILKK